MVSNLHVFFDLNPNFLNKLSPEDVVRGEQRKLGQIITKFRKTYLILFKKININVLVHFTWAKLIINISLQDLQSWVAYSCHLYILYIYAFKTDK